MRHLKKAVKQVRTDHHPFKQDFFQSSDVSVLKKQMAFLSHESSQNQSSETLTKLDELESHILNDLLNIHQNVLKNAQSLGIEWLDRRIEKARVSSEKNDDNNITAIDFIKQTLAIHKYATSIRQLEWHAAQLKNDDVFVLDLNSLKESHSLNKQLFKKLNHFIHSDQYDEINALSKNSDVPAKAIHQLHQNLYSLDLRHNKEDKKYFVEMLEVVNLYCQEMKKEYTQDDPERFSKGIVKLLQAYHEHRKDLSADILQIHRKNLGLSGLGGLGVLTFKINNDDPSHHKLWMDPNFGQLALARALSKHSGLFGHQCSKHEEQKEAAWDALKEATTANDQVKVLQGLAADIRRQHQSKTKIGGAVGRLFRHSKLASQIEKEASQLEMAIEKATI